MTVPRRFPVTAEFGPYEMQVDGLRGSSTSIACDASTPHHQSGSGGGTVGVWASVSADGRAQFGWYEAERTSATAAELEAIRRTLMRYPMEGAGMIEVTTDSSTAAEAVVRLRSGEWPLQHAGHYVHRELLEDTRAECLSRSFAMTVVSNPRHRNYVPTHRLLQAAHVTAWTVNRLLCDALPLDDVALAFLRQFANARHRHKTRTLEQYRAWASRRIPGRPHV